MALQPLKIAGEESKNRQRFYFGGPGAKFEIVS